MARRASSSSRCCSTPSRGPREVEAADRAVGSRSAHLRRSGSSPGLSGVMLGPQGLATRPDCSGPGAGSRGTRPCAAWSRAGSTPPDRRPATDHDSGRPRTPDDVQQDDHRAPPVRVPDAPAERRADGEAGVRRDGERRRDGHLRHCAARHLNAHEALPSASLTPIVPVSVRTGNEDESSARGQLRHAARSTPTCRTRSSDCRRSTSRWRPRRSSSRQCRPTCSPTSPSSPRPRSRRRPPGCRPHRIANCCTRLRTSRSPTSRGPRQPLYLVGAGHVAPVPGVVGDGRPRAEHHRAEYTGQP